MVIKQYSNEYLKDLNSLMNLWSNDYQYNEKDIVKSLEVMTVKSENKVFLAVNDEDKAIGYCFAGICYYLGQEPFVEVIQLMVNDENRSQGIGTKLIEHVADHYKKLGINKVKLSSRIEREQAHKFYRKHGFKEFKQSIFFEKDI